MAHVVVLDPLYPEMEEATLGQWLVTVGDMVTPGQPLAELITDKVAYEYQSPEAGMILVLLSPEKSVVPVGTVLAVIGDANEQVANLAALEAENRRLAEAREAELAAVQQATTAQVVPEDAQVRRQEVRATPAARRLARERGVDLTALRGSGPGGMITVEDIP